MAPPKRKETAEVALSPLHAGAPPEGAGVGADFHVDASWQQAVEELERQASTASQVKVAAPMSPIEIVPAKPVPQGLVNHTMATLADVFYFSVHTL